MATHKNSIKRHFVELSKENHQSNSIFYSHPIINFAFAIGTTSTHTQQHTHTVTYNYNWIKNKKKKNRRETRCDAMRRETRRQLNRYSQAAQSEGVAPSREPDEKRGGRGGDWVVSRVNLGLVGFWIMQLSRSLLACKFFLLECVARKCLNDTRFRQAAIRNISDIKKKNIAVNYSYIKAPPAAKRVHSVHFILIMA